MAITTVKASMSFKRADDKSVTISVVDARPTLDAAAVNAAMDLILLKNIFAPQGFDLKTKTGGKLISTSVEAFEMTEI